MKKLNLILVALFIVAVWYFGFKYVSAPVIIIVAGSMTIGFFCWLATTFKKPLEPMVILPPFLLMLAALLIHIMEEYYMGFPQAISALFHVNFSRQTFLLVFEQIGPIIYLLVILGLLYKNHFANFFAWFLFIGMGLGEIMHFVFPIIAGGPYHYFPGMYTAILPILGALWCIMVVHRHTRAHS